MPRVWKELVSETIVSGVLITTAITKPTIIAAITSAATSIISTTSSTLTTTPPVRKHNFFWVNLYTPQTVTCPLPFNPN